MYEAHRTLLETAFGDLSTGVLTSLALAADELELTIDPALTRAEDDGAGARRRRVQALRLLAGGVLAAVRHAHRMAALEAKARHS